MPPKNSKGNKKRAQPYHESPRQSTRKSKPTAKKAASGNQPTAESGQQEPQVNPIQPPEPQPSTSQINLTNGTQQMPIPIPDSNQHNLVMMPNPQVVTSQPSSSQPQQQVTRQEFDELRSTMGSIRDMFNNFMSSYVPPVPQPVNQGGASNLNNNSFFNQPASVPLNNVIVNQPVASTSNDPGIPGTSNTMSATDGAASMVLNQAVTSHIRSISEGQATGKPKGDKVSYQLDRKIPHSLMQDIWDDKFVDLELLIDTNDDPEAPLMFKSVNNNDFGQVIQLMKPKKPKGITNISQWSNAFDIYIAVYTRKFFHETANLLTYSNKVKQVHAKGGDFLKYDEEFRKSRAQYGTAWETPDLELLVECNQAGLQTQINNIINSLNKNQNINLPFQAPPPRTSQTLPNPGIPRGHVTITTTQADVGGSDAISPTCATLQGVARSIQYSGVPKHPPHQQDPVPTLALGHGPVTTEDPPPPMPTPIHPNKLYEYLDGYDHSLRQYLYQGFTKGFSLFNFQSHPQPPPPNLKSSSELPEIVDQKLLKESKLGRISGPYNSPPMPDMVFSPLGLQPKKAQGQYRVIHHLSFPKGKSVNDGIPEEYSSVKYSSVGQAIHSIVKLGSGAFLAKTDIQSAFRIVPVSPADYPLLGFKWRGQYYHDRCLPMGCSSSCAIFERVSTALEWIIQQRVKDVIVLHILDDFLIIAPTYSSCLSTLNLFISICQDIGVPLAPDKTVGPSQVLEFAGIRLDTVQMVASLPPDKIDKFSSAIQNMLESKSVQLKQIQSLAGMLNFACGVIAPARAFSRRLYNLSIGLSRPYHHRKITREVRADLLVWKNFLDSYNSKTFFLDYNFLSQDLLHLYTDSSSTIGYGGVFGHQWFHGLWSDSTRGSNIAILELYPICLAIKLWGEQLSNKCLQINSDNMAVVHIINNSTSKDPTIMTLLRSLILDCMYFNIIIRSSHLIGKNNVLCDLLSRDQVHKAIQLYPQLLPTPTPVPSQWELDQLLIT